jgi:predicted acetyltransferase
MDIEVRTIAPEEYEAWALPLTLAFGDEPRPEWTELDAELLEFDRTLGAVVGGDFVGAATVFSLELSVPGSVLPMAGVSMVGVLPTHRRRGINTALMRRILEDVRDQGREPLLGLWASESGIYGRFGYGVATMIGGIKLPRRYAAFRETGRPDEGRLRLVTDRAEGLAAIAAVYEPIRASVPGLVSRPSPAHWAFRFMDIEAFREGAGPFIFAIHEGAGGPDGYAVYRIKHGYTDDGLPDGEVQVSEVIGSSLDARLALFRYLVDVDLTARTSWWGCPVDTELFHLLEEPRELRMRVQDGMYLRVIDVEATLGSRRYAVDGRIAIGVRDDECPWVEGTYVLEGGPDGADCRRDERATPDLVVGVRVLGSMFLGGVGVGALARAGLIDEETSGAVPLSHAMFATELAPWCPSFF